MKLFNQIREKVDVDASGNSKLGRLVDMDGDYSTDKVLFK